MKKETATIISLAILMVAACLASASDYYVNVKTGSNHNSGSSRDAAWKTVTRALAVAIGTQDNQCIVHIAPGRYAPPLEVFPLRLQSYTSLVGTDAGEVILDAAQTAYVVYVWGKAGIVLSRISITGGYATRPFECAGISMWGTYDAVLRECAIYGNHGVVGGLQIVGGGYVEVVDCIIRDNSSDGTAGGMYVIGDASTRKGHLGAPDSGGTTVTATRCVITSNHAHGAGGIGVVSARLELSDSVVSYNVVSSPDREYRHGDGSAVWVFGNGTDPEFIATNCLFLANASQDSVGGIASVSLYAPGRAATFRNCTFAGNQTIDGVNGIDTSIYYDYSLGAVEVTDCIFRDGGDEIWEERAGLVVVENSCIEGGWDGRGQGNFDADPLFVSGPFSDYYLSQTAAGQQEDSPCVDAGSRTAAEAGMAAKTTRTDGMADTGVVDIGFHYPMLFMQPQVWVSTPSDAYIHGDTLQIVFQAINPNPFSYPVDLYAAIIAADGVIWTIDASWVWSAQLNPWFASLQLPAGFTFGPTTLLTIALPSAAPPISAPGTYWVAAAFSYVGTTTFIGQPSLAPFELAAEH